MEIVSNCCGAKVEGLNADNIGRCLECGEGCGVEEVSSHCVKHNKSICKECQKDGLWDFGVPEKEGCGVEEVWSKEEIIKEIKEASQNPAEGTNSMGCGERFYNKYFMVGACFEDEELAIMSETELQSLIKLADFASDAFY